MALHSPRNWGPFSDATVWDRLIEWKLGSIRIARCYNDSPNGKRLREEHPMQRQFSIELRVDYEDVEKNEAMRKALQAAARHVYATAMLLKDSVKPQVAIYSDDFFVGHEEIPLMEDTVQEGMNLIGGDKQTEVSSEMLDAFK